MKEVNLTWSELGFEYIKTKCHLEYYYRNGKWDDGKVVEEDRISMHMASTCLHYGQECFEGLKAYKNKDGKVTLFRVKDNASRLVRTAEKILMTPFPEDKFVESVKRIVQLNKEYVPPYGSGAVLYIRPLLLGISGIIGVKPSTEYLYLIFCLPVGPYFKGGMKPITLYIEEEIDRASPGGVGDIKVGGNYASGLRGTTKAYKLGFKEALYLDARDKKYIDESGPANFFGITKDNKYITPQSPSVLPSITNRSLMVLAKEEFGMEVEQRKIPVEEIFELKEVGCCGTAAVIIPVKSITYRDKTKVYCENDQIGPVSKKLYEKLTAIQHGDDEDKYGWNTVIPM
jgi:branched-chain amino acid aminotransferase